MARDTLAACGAEAYAGGMMKKLTVVLCVSLLAACAPTMSRTTDGNIVTVSHTPSDFSFALEHALEVCTERKLNIRHISTEPAADPSTRTSRFECVKK
jgi:hypothetical protein